VTEPLTSREIAELREANIHPGGHLARLLATLDVALADHAEYDTEQQRLDLGPEESARRLGHRYTGRSTGDYYFSLDGEAYNGDGSFDAAGALAEARDYRDDDDEGLIYTGRSVKRSLASLVLEHHHSIETMLDGAREDAYGWVGDFSEDFLRGVTDAQKEELRDVLMRAIDRWADKHQLQPTFFGVDDVEEHQRVGYRPGGKE